MTDEKMEWGNVSLPTHLLKQAEQISKRHNYTSVAEFMRDAVRQLILKYQELEAKEGID